MQYLRGIVFAFVGAFLPVLTPSRADDTATPPGKTVPNLVKDGSFEEAGSLAWGADSWRQAYRRVITTADEAHDGERSAIINIVGPEDDARIVQAIDVKPGTRYRASGWAKTAGVAFDPPGGRLGAHLCLFDRPGQSESLVGDRGWTRLEFEFDTGEAEHVQLAARLGSFSSTVTGTAWFDDLSVVEIAPATPANAPPAPATGPAAPAPGIPSAGPTPPAPISPPSSDAGMRAFFALMVIGPLVVPLMVLGITVAVARRRHARAGVAPTAGAILRRSGAPLAGMGFGMFVIGIFLPPILTTMLPARWLKGAAGAPGMITMMVLCVPGIIVAMIGAAASLLKFAIPQPSTKPASVADLPAPAGRPEPMRPLLALLPGTLLLAIGGLFLPAAIISLIALPLLIGGGLTVAFVLDQIGDTARVPRGGARTLGRMLNWLGSAGMLMAIAYTATTFGGRHPLDLDLLAVMSSGLPPMALIAAGVRFRGHPSWPTTLAVAAWCFLTVMAIAAAGSYVWPHLPKSL